ncbi:MAG: tetraacyldisaccharide 4'-kinase [Planctomycetaceae bacterium]|jgi:tetraacyldisaccharide 4'-kinase|nr:tetraacyldisaccharide 4'-kinase [Planctomycetaceae bacterium]MBT6157462.1 tetraacyldisaccharide 4'-kinase [Planctomycetaceae bacterium]MBT6488101.1 tetraacyldisaccharide 4'-kinase [Planctomycetaceae bacterium]MBT6494102.1 tetraacyldisaccharide 4'-kinase [Planctomycetaceae bacterium]
MDEAAFREIISGDKRGAVPTVARGALAGLSLFYGAAVRLRNRAFDAGLKRVHKAAVPVVSVGNITTGGTGKTPMVAWLAHWFQDYGLRPVILSRGYRSLSGEINDEKLVLDQLSPGVPHLQNPDRVDFARFAVEEHGAQVLILDDGFQHRRLARDLDIVLIDALNPFGYGRLLPRGLLREPLIGLKRAGLIVLTRADQIDENSKRQIIERISEIRGTADHVEVAFSPQCLINSSGQTADLSSLPSQLVTVFCGIGNPAAFSRTVTDCGFQIADGDPLSYPDHYHYRMGDLTHIADLADVLQTTAILTTQKDLVKINEDHLGSVPLWAIQIAAKIVSGADVINDHLNRILQ